MNIQLPERGTTGIVDVINYELIRTIARAQPEIVKFINVVSDAIYPTTNDTVLFYALYNSNTIIASGRGRGNFPQFQVQVQSNQCQMNGKLFGWTENNEWVQYAYLTKDDEAIFYARSIPNITAILPNWNNQYLNQTPDFIFYLNQTQDKIYATFDNKMIEVDGVRWARYQNNLQVYSTNDQYWQDADKFFTDTRKATITNLCRNAPTIEYFVDSNFIAPQTNDVKFYAIKNESKIIAAQLGNQTTIDECYKCRFQDTKFNFIEAITKWAGNGNMQYQASGDTGGSGSIDLPLFVYKDINNTGDQLINITAQYHFTQRASVASNPNTPNLILDFSNLPEVAEIQFLTIEEHLYANSTGSPVNIYSSIAKRTITGATGTISLANDADGLNYIYHKFDNITTIKLADTNRAIIREYYLDFNALINQGVNTNYNTDITGETIIKRVV